MGDWAAIASRSGAQIQATDGLRIDERRNLQYARFVLLVGQMDREGNRNAVFRALDRCRQRRACSWTVGCSLRSIGIRVVEGSQGGDHVSASGAWWRLQPG